MRVSAPVHWIVRTAARWLARWPVPALAVWLAAWGAHGAMALSPLPPVARLLAGLAVGVLGAFLGGTRLRRLVIAAGYPASVVALGLAAGTPVWLWVLPFALLLALYPVRAWSDAPLFPTPADALHGLHRAAPLVGDRSRGNPRVLDAGCGLGHGLRALRREYPQASIEGVEWSWPIMLACGLRCSWADVRQGDLWKTDWAGFDLVYLFQRPESMHRAVEKASREMRPSAYLVSLEFEAPDLRPVAVLPGGSDGRKVWIYRPAVRPEKRHRPRALLTSPAPLDGPMPGRVVHDVVDAVECPPRR